MKIYFINLDRSTERLEAMKEAFSDYELIRVRGVDGWSDEYTKGGIVSDENRVPVWRTDKRSELIKCGTMHKDSILSPSAVGCNLSHIRAVQTFLDTGDEWAIILEDDVEPTERWDGPENIEVPSNCDFFYLPSADHPGDRLRLLEDGQIWCPRTLMGYALNRKAAKLFLKAAEPMKYLLDWQIPTSCAESLSEERLRKKWIPEGVEWGDTFMACGLHTNGYVRHNELAKKSCMTKDGAPKLWIQANRDIR